MKGPRGNKGILVGIVLAAALAAGGCGKVEMPAWENSGEQQQASQEKENVGVERLAVPEESQAEGGGAAAEDEGGSGGNTGPVSGESQAGAGAGFGTGDGGPGGDGSQTTTVMLPAEGGELSDFVPEGWVLMDSVTLDFNEDGILDYVGVLESQAALDSEGESYELASEPRILFAAASDGGGRYHLNFSNEYLIRTAVEGGPFGDPYEPLTANGRSFTTHSYGGSSWKWSEAYTYTYKNNSWYLTASEETGSFGGYTTSHDINDYETGIGLRQKRSTDTDEIMKNISNLSTDYESLGYDLTYEVKLDPPLPLREAGMRRFRLQSGREEWPVASIRIAEGLDRKTPVMLPRDQAYFRYQDGDCLLYSYKAISDEIWYLTLYSLKDQKLSVLAQEETPIDDILRYQDKIYYTAEIKGLVSYKEYNGNIRQSQEQVGIKLICMSMDGTDSREIFSYELPGWEGEVLEGNPPFMYLSSEISGGEIITEVSIEGHPHPFYRMNLDGSGLQMIGTVPKE